MNLRRFLLKLSKQTELAKEKEELGA